MRINGDALWVDNCKIARSCDDWVIVRSHRAGRAPLVIGLPRLELVKRDLKCSEVVVGLPFSNYVCVCVCLCVRVRVCVY